MHAYQFQWNVFLLVAAEMDGVFTWPYRAVFYRDTATDNDSGCSSHETSLFSHFWRNYLAAIYYVAIQHLIFDILRSYSMANVAADHANFAPKIYRSHMSSILHSPNPSLIRLRGNRQQSAGQVALALCFYRTIVAVLALYRIMISLLVCALYGYYFCVKYGRQKYFGNCLIC